MTLPHLLVTLGTTAAYLLVRDPHTWLHRSRAAAVSVCWQLLLSHLGAPALLMRALLLVHRAWRARRSRGHPGDPHGLWARLEPVEALVMAVESAGWPGEPVEAVAAVLTLCRDRVAAFRRPTVTAPSRPSIAAESCEIYFGFFRKCAPIAPIGASPADVFLLP